MAVHVQAGGFDVQAGRFDVEAGGSDVQAGGLGGTIMTLRSALPSIGLACVVAVAGSTDPTPAGHVAFLSAFVADSAELHGMARDAQARFERERIRHAPFTWQGGSGECTEIVGRICLRFDRAEETVDPWVLEPTPPAEAEPVQEARIDLLEVLDRVAGEIPGDAWVAGQRVRYRLEAGDPDGALQAAQACRSPRPGWCAALSGLALWALERPAAAERSFHEALSALDPEERHAWLDPEWLVDVEIWRALRGMEGLDREVMVERIWRRADPWFSTPWNELLLAHLARHVQARIRDGTRTPYGLRWGDDLTQILVRFGVESGFERVRESTLRLGPADVIGRHQSGARHHLPAPEAILEPASDGTAPPVGPGAFTTERRVARSLHRPGPVPRIRDLRVQLARFPRGRDSVLVAVAWEAPAPPPGHPYREAFATDSVPPPAPLDPEPELWMQPWEPDPDERGLVDPDGRGLVAPDGSGMVEPDGRGLSALGGKRVAEAAHPELAATRPGGAGFDGPTRGHAVFRAPAGNHLASLEIREPEFDRGWRFRRFVDRMPMPGSGPALSDLLLLRVEDSSGSIDEAPALGAEDGPVRAGGAVGLRAGGRVEEGVAEWVTRALPELRVASGLIEIGWEVRGLPRDFSSRALEFRLQVEPRERGLVRRLGEWLRLVDPEGPTRIRWVDHVEPHPALEGVVPRSLRIDLGELAPGLYELRLELMEGDRVRSESTLRIEVTGDRSGQGTGLR